MNTIIKKSRIEVRQPTPEELAAMSARTSEDAQTCEVVDKSVRLLRDRGLVHALELTCSCGEVTVVSLEYPPDEPPSEPASEPTNEPPSEEA